MKNKQILIALLLVFTLLLSGCGKVTEAQEAIAGIGTVTMDSESAIIYAEQLFASLSEKQQAKVENASVLTDARAEYDRMNQLITETEAAIAAIGTVTVDSGDVIQKARNLYHALISEKLDSYVSHLLPILEEAEKNYDLALIQAEYDEAAALYAEKNYSDAADLLNDFIEAHPKSDLIASAKEMATSCYVKEAISFMEQEDLQTALKLLTVIPEVYGSDSFTEEFIKTRTAVYDALEERRPETAYFLFDELDSGYGEFTLENESEYDVCVKLEKEDDPEQYVMFYVRANETHNFSLEDGTYLLKYATGKYWFNDEIMFGDFGGYVKAAEPFEIETVYLSTSIQYSVMTYTINPSSGQGNSRTTDIDPDDF